MNAIEIMGVSKRIRDFSINDLNLVVPGGCVVGLIGENGAGKSTTIKLIMDLVHKDFGSIKVLGRDNVYGLDDVKHQIGVVFDDCTFPQELSAIKLGNIMKLIYRNWDDQKFREYLIRFGLDEKKRIRDYSRGMKMKLSIAVALSHNAKLLILDEATSGLDPVVRDEIIDILIDFTSDEEHSILISSHIISDLEKICDYVAFLHKGRLVMFEEKDRLYEQYCTIHCTENDLKRIPVEAIIGSKVGAYGAEAIVHKESVPEGIERYPIDIEKLFIFMIKERW